MKKNGFFTLMLHAHLPFINHPDFKQYMEERWLFEAITETYIPFLMVFKNLESKNIFFRITMSITPPLMEMLVNKDLQEKYLNYLDSSIALAKKEIEKTKDENEKKLKMANYYFEKLNEIKKFYLECNGNILSEFASFQEKGYLEIITCNATHGFLPLMLRYPEAVKAQIEIGVQTYENYMGKKPRGTWLAECAYVPGVDKFLSEAGLKFFFVDTHGLIYGDPTPKYGVYEPVITPEGVFVLARDPESSQQVWSAEVGYPGDPAYREFYKDVGFERDDEYISPYIDPSGIRCNTGIKYYRITGKNVSIDDKDYYDIDKAKEIVKIHAKDFAHKKKEQILRLSKEMGDVAPNIVAPFDAELYGHWWYEGPMFIEALFEELASIPEVIPATPPEVFDRMEAVQIVVPNSSTWGANGYNEVWLNGKNDWIYRHLDEMTERMIRLATIHKNTSNPNIEAALNQMARELLLAQSSDWAFIITTGTTVEYAENRTKFFLNNFMNIEKEVNDDNIDKKYIEKLNWLDAIFPKIDFRVFAKN